MNSFLVLNRILDQAAAYLTHGTVPDGHEVYENGAKSGRPLQVYYRHIWHITPPMVSHVL
jgi:hypothetical protein